MSERSYRRPWTYGAAYVEYPLTIQSNGATGPTVTAGDTKSSFLTVVRGASGIAGVTGVTGTYVVTSVDPFLAVIWAQAQIIIVGQAAGSWTVEMGTPVQNANKTWSVPFTVFSSGVATDIPTGGGAYISVKFKNSLAYP